MREMQGGKREEVISRWLQGDPIDKISLDTGYPSATINRIINEWKKELGSGVLSAYMKSANSGFSLGNVNENDMVQALKLMSSLKKLGIDAPTVDDFVLKFSRTVLSAGISPEGLATIVNQILKLAELDGIEIHQIPAQIETLQATRNELLAEIEALKKSLENQNSINAKSSPPQFPDNSVPARNSDNIYDSSNHDGSANVIDENLVSKISTLKKQLDDYGISLEDVGAFADMISNAKNYGFEFTTILDFVSGINALGQEKERLAEELESLKTMIKSFREEEVFKKEDLSKENSIRESVNNLLEVGFEKVDFEQIHEDILKVAKSNNFVDFGLAKKQFMEDLQSLYANGNVSNAHAKDEHSLQHVQSEQNEFLSRQQKYSTELLDMVDRLTSRGVSETTLIKCTVINEIFKIDLDTLADDIRKYKNLMNAAKHWEKRRMQLESEELVLKHKIVALEEQRLRTIASLDELPKLDSDLTATGVYSKELGLAPLLMAVQGRRGEVNSNELNTSLLRAIELISNVLEPTSLTRKILDHAKFSLSHDRDIPQ